MFRTYSFVIAAIVILAACFAAVGCVSLDADNQYAATLHRLTVRAVYPEGFEAYVREGVEVRVTENITGNTRTETTDAEGKAEFTLSEGFYNVSVSDIQGRRIFNGSADRIRLAGGDMSMNLLLSDSYSSPLVISEIYCGGCSKYPDEGHYTTDKYIILHNYSDETYYLDGLCFGMLEPYNATGTNLWVKETESGTVFPDFLPVGETVWQFGGSGKDFPLEKGEDAVLAINGAIDHTLQYPNSVNLNDSRYFVCYNQVYYPNTTYHPVPGDLVLPSHYLTVVTKVGPSTGYPFSQTSPAVVIFRAVDCDMAEYVAREGSVLQKPGSTVMRVVKIPYSWIVDAVEVFDESMTTNKKRFPPSIDAGYVYFSGGYRGHTLHRCIDEEATAEEGYTIYKDTNNSTADFYERERQSLKDMQ